jgi:hypothetical protein
MAQIAAKGSQVNAHFSSTTTRFAVSVLAVLMLLISVSRRLAAKGGARGPL